jgi:hypothetical protein
MFLPLDLLEEQKTSKSLSLSLENRLFSTQSLQIFTSLGILLQKRGIKPLVSNQANHWIPFSFNSF